MGSFFHDVVLKKKKAKKNVNKRLKDTTAGMKIRAQNARYNYSRP
jgi:hypothetical protein